MKNFLRVKHTELFLCLIFLALVSSQDVIEQNGTKSVNLQDPKIDSTIKSALENGTVSEVVVRKDLLLFPVNAPNLVIAHTQEIHAVPQNNGSNETDGKPTAAQVAEVNEYSLSQLVSTNDTDDNNGTNTQYIPASAPLSQIPENDSVLEPGKLLEIVTGINLSEGLVTEKVAVPSEAQNLSFPKQSIVGLLSKSLAPPDNPAVISTTPAGYVLEKRSVDSKDDDSSSKDDGDSTNSTEIVKRSVDSEEDDDDDDSGSDSTEDDSSSSDSTEMVKRSVDSKEVDDDDDDDDDSASTEENKSSSETLDDDSSESTEKVKRSADSDEDDDVDDSSISNSTEYYDHKVKRSPKNINILGSQGQKFSNDEPLNEINNEKESLNDDSMEDMDVAEDIVFRPLFRYRQETQLKQQYYPSRRSNYRRPTYNSFDYGNRYRYKTDDSDYD